MSLNSDEDLAELIRVFLAYYASFLEEFAHWYTREPNDMDDFHDELMGLKPWQYVAGEEARWEGRILKARQEYEDRLPGVSPDETT